MGLPPDGQQFRLPVNLHKDGRFARAQVRPWWRNAPELSRQW